MDELDCADVDAAGGLPDQEEIGVPVELAGQHDLLLVAARERRRGERTVAGPNVVLGDLSIEARPDRSAAEPDRAVVGRLVVVPEDGALARRERHDEPHALAVLGHVGEPELSQASRDRKSTRLNYSHVAMSYAVLCLK